MHTIGPWESSAYETPQRTTTCLDPDYPIPAIHRSIHLWGRVYTAVYTKIVQLLTAMEEDLSLAGDDPSPARHEAVSNVRLLNCDFFTNVAGYSSKHHGLIRKI
jgi:hypothetical protein